MYKNKLNGVDNKISFNTDDVDNDVTIEALQEYNQMKKDLTHYKRYDNFAELLDEVRKEK